MDNKKRSVGEFVGDLIVEAKETVKEEIIGLGHFACESPFLFGRYIAFEGCFALMFIYAMLKKQHLEWTDNE